VRNEKDRREVDYSPRRLEPRIFNTEDVWPQEKEA
jgi:hypothetical protein